MSTHFTLIVSQEHSGERLDKVLSFHVEIKSRNRALHLIEQNSVLVNNKVQKASYLCKENDLITFKIQLNVENNEIQKFDLKLDIVFEDNDLIVLNKPSGLVVHPAAGHAADTLVNALVNYTSELSMKFGENRPGIVHRIDKETSGLLVVAKNDFTHQHLSAQFKIKSTHRVYQAVVLGNIPVNNGTISSYLARHPVDRKKYASVKSHDKKIIQSFSEDPVDGKWAVTHFKKISTAHDLSLLELKLETGRTHQIRIHLSEKGYPIVGDQLYGAEKKLHSIKSKSIKEQIKLLSRFYLHAAELGFVHPRTSKELFFSIPWPEVDKKIIEFWGLLK